MKSEVVGLIMESISTVVHMEEFETWAKAENPNDEDFIVFNNSFIYRDGLATNKSRQYLAVKYPFEPLEDRAYVLTIDGTINSDFKIVSSRSGNFSAQAIQDALESELNSLGDVIFVLIGTLFDDVSVEEPLSHESYKKVKYEPMASQPAEIIDGTTILVGDYRNEEQLWGHVATLVCEESAISLKEPFSKAIKNIKKSAVLRLELPPIGSHGSGQTMLDELGRNLTATASEYRTSLEEFAKDQLTSITTISCGYHTIFPATLYG